jgi:hypothetical protein
VTIDHILTEGRAARLTLMRDTVRITRPSGPPVFDAATGTYTPVGPSTVVYEGAADVKPRPISATDVQVGQRESVTTDYDVALPWSASPVVQVDDKLEVLTSGDPLFTGRVLTVTAVVFGARRTAHHLTCEDAT